MSQNTSIEWADDSVSFWWGCEKIAPGCKNCYAVPISQRFGGDIWGKNKPRLRIASATETCRKLNRKAENEGKPRIVFVNSMSDFFEEHDGPIIDRAGQQLYRCPNCNLIQTAGGVNGSQNTWHCRNGLCFPVVTETLTLSDLRREAFQVIDECPWLRFLLLTKRPENVRQMWPIDSADMSGRHRKNIWLGCSVSDQTNADAMIPHLLECSDLCPVIFLSVEPLLGPIRLDERLLMPIHGTSQDGKRFIDWVIIGGESGPKARSCDVAWIRSLVAQCKAAGVPAFVKQLGSNSDARTSGAIASDGVPLANPKGGDPAEWPEDLRVREFPLDMALEEWVT